MQILLECILVLACAGLGLAALRVEIVEEDE